MTESEWLACQDPQAMLAHLGDGYSRRKLRLFAVACCRRAWADVTHPDSRAAVGVAERFADGLAAEDELEAASRAAGWAAKWAAGRAAHQPDQPDQRKAQADLIRSIAGNPWRPVTLPGPKSKRSCCMYGRDGWVLNAKAKWEKHGKCDDEGYVVKPCPWLTPDVLSLAEAAYAERLGDFTLDPARLAVLSDALEEAGCVSEKCGECKEGFRYVCECFMYDCGEFGDECRRPAKRGCRACRETGRVVHPLLAALRSPGPHYRGFWPLDLILGLK